MQLKDFAKLLDSVIENVFDEPVTITGIVSQPTVKPRSIQFVLTDEGVALPVTFSRSEDVHILLRDLETRQMDFHDGLDVTVEGQLQLQTPTLRPRLKAQRVVVQGDSHALVEQRELLLQLGQEGVFDAQKQLQLHQVPLRIVALAPPQSQGLEDVVGVLRSSPWDFRVRVVWAPMSANSGPEIVRRLQQAIALRPQVIIIVRGGGEGITTPFNDPVLVRAIAACPIPVLVGVGHTSDQSLAEMAAYASYGTPSLLATALVDRVQRADERLISEAQRLVAAWRDELREIDERVAKANKKLEEKEEENHE